MVFNRTPGDRSDDRKLHPRECFCRGVCARVIINVPARGAREAKFLDICVCQCTQNARLIRSSCKEHGNNKHSRLNLLLHAHNRMGVSARENSNESLKC